MKSDAVGEWEARRNHEDSKTPRKTPEYSFVKSFVSWCLCGCDDSTTLTALFNFGSR